MLYIVIFILLLAYTFRLNFRILHHSQDQATDLPCLCCDSESISHFLNWLMLGKSFMALQMAFHTIASSLIAWAFRVDSSTYNMVHSLGSFVWCDLLYSGSLNFLLFCRQIFLSNFFLKLKIPLEWLKDILEGYSVDYLFRSLCLMIIRFIFIFIFFFHDCWCREEKEPPSTLMWTLFLLAQVWFLSSMAFIELTL